MVIFSAVPSVTMSVIWASALLAAYVFLEWTFTRVPFLPVATVGTAVAFYVGFKNNSAYDRFWEGRKIWGGIVNASRSFGNGALAYVYEDADHAQRILVYRHLAWLNALRIQLRKKSRYHEWRDKRRNRYRWIELVEKKLRQDFGEEVGTFLSDEERAEVESGANPATQILRLQGQHLRELADSGELDMFRQLELMAIVQELYALQGKCERIKNTPFPRQYAYYARIFTWAFVTLVPCGLLDVFGEHISLEALQQGDVMAAISMVLSSALVSWVFLTMEVVGDYSEDPFEGSFTDVPMNALSRTIEIDLRQMLGEEEVPESEKPLGNILY